MLFVIFCNFPLTLNAPKSSKINFLRIILHIIFYYFACYSYPRSENVRYSSHFDFKSILCQIEKTSDKYRPIVQKVKLEHLLYNEKYWLITIHFRITHFYTLKLCL